LSNFFISFCCCFNLALAIGYATPETVELLVSKGAREALALAKEANIQTSETVKEQLAEAEGAAKVIEAQMPDVPVEEKKEEVKEEPKPEPVEEKKEEPEQPKEEPKPVEEPKQEEPKDVVTNAPEEKLEETVKEEVEKADEPEQKEAATKTDEEVAQEVLRKLTSEKIRQEDSGTTESSSRADASAPNMDKLIVRVKFKLIITEVQPWNMFMLEW